MERRVVRSKNLAAVGYDRDSDTLEIEFQNGHWYRYPDVPRIIFEELFRAPSPGRYFTSRIKDRYRLSQLR
jgi:hypothetical protein